MTLLTRNEFCRKFKVSQTTLTRLIRSGRVRVVRLGRLVRIVDPLADEPGCQAAADSPDRPHNDGRADP